LEESTAITIDSYDRTAASFAEKNYQIEMLEQKARFTGLLPAGERPALLDLGCGPGRDTLYFGQQGYAVVGADLSAGMLAEAVRRVPGGGFVQADMRCLPFATNSFGGIWACASLLHLPRPDAPLALAEMARVLSPGGALFLGVKRGFDESWRGHEDDELRFFFTYYLPSEIWDKVAEAGFEVRAIAENVSPTRTEPDGSPVRWINLYAVKGSRSQ
jgi:ubiquinone/menaquinone biosynthesis C-methylase UbiE